MFNLLPTSPCDECLGDALDALDDEPDCLTVSYCPHEAAGAIFEAALGFWRVYSPVSREAFGEFLAREFEARAAIAAFDDDQEGTGNDSSEN